MKKKTTPKKSATKVARIAPPLHLAGLLALIEEEDDRRLRRVLSGVRRILALSAIDARRDAIFGLIESEGASGPWAKVHQYLLDIDNTREDPHGHGDYVNLYANPALVIGICLGYVYATDGAR